MLSMSPCNLCPRECGVFRSPDGQGGGASLGRCRCGGAIRVARAALHFWEEPCISGTRGSGTVFFSGCTLRCRYCQNASISLEGFGKEVSPQRLSEIFLELQEKGAHNINLVTAAQYILPVMEALDRAKPRLRIPVVYNCGGYERIETIRALQGYVDIFLPDLKYFSSELSAKYSGAPDYFETASAAISQMVAQTGNLVFDPDGILQKGVVIRHLVLPGARRDSIRILNWIERNLPKGQYRVSLMSQYTPYRKDAEYPELNRRITSFEYQSVVEEAIRLGLTDGYMQERTSAKEEYTPPFNLEGIED